MPPLNDVCLIERGVVCALSGTESIEMEPSLQRSDTLSLSGDDLVARLEALRDFLGSVTRKLSVRDFAGQLSGAVGRRVSPSTVQRWLSGQGAPDAYEIVGVAKLAETSVERFMEGLKPPTTKRRAKPVRGKVPSRPSPAKRVAKG